MAEPLACQHFLNTARRRAKRAIQLMLFLSLAQPPPGSLPPSRATQGVWIPVSVVLIVFFSTILLLSFSLILSLPPPNRISFSFLLVPLFENLCLLCVHLCLCIGPCLQACEPLLLGPCPLSMYTSLSAKLFLDVCLDVCKYVCKSFHSGTPSLAL